MMDEHPQISLSFGEGSGRQSRGSQSVPAHPQARKKRFKGKFLETFRLCQLRNPCITYNLWVLRESWIFRVRLG